MPGMMSSSTPMSAEQMLKSFSQRASQSDAANASDIGKCHGELQQTLSNIVDCSWLWGPFMSSVNICVSDDFFLCLPISVNGTMVNNETPKCIATANAMV